MNKVRVLAFLLMLTNGLFAQIKSGSTAYGLLLNAYENSYKGSATSVYTNWSLNGIVNTEFFMKDNLSINIQPNYIINQNIYFSTTSTGKYINRSTAENYSIGLGIKRYVRLSERAQLFIAPSYFPVFIENTNYLESTNYSGITSKRWYYKDTWNHNIYLNAGINCFISKNLALIAQCQLIRFSIYKATNTFSFLPTSLNVSFGVNYFILMDRKYRDK